MQPHTISMGQRQFRIGDLANELKVKKFVIRFWEQEFGLSAERSEGGHRFYTTADLRIFQIIKDLLHNQGYTIEGARKQLPLLLKECAPIATPVPATIAAPSAIVETSSPATEAVALPLQGDSKEPVVEVIPVALSVQPAVESPLETIAITPHEVSTPETIEGAHIDAQPVVRTCHHEDNAHVPASIAPCTTCEKHSRHLLMVKDELEALVKRLR